VICVTDDKMLIDHVAASDSVLGYEPAELLGRPIMSLVDDANVSALLVAFQEAFRTRTGVSTAVGVRTKSGKVLQCEAVVVPMIPARSSALALVPKTAVGVSDAVTARQRFVQGLRDRLPDNVTIPGEDVVSGISRLTSRELQVVRRLVSGDRVRAISDGLFLSTSTVRNHLSSVYRKLGVRSQQELVDRFRAADLGSPNGDSATSSADVSATKPG
jgi:PAS domain S-box-containing protein